MRGAAGGTAATCRTCPSAGLGRLTPQGQRLPTALLSTAHKASHAVHGPTHHSAESPALSSYRA